MLTTIKTLWFIGEETGRRFDFVEMERAARVIRRNSATLQRINEARCNGVERWSAAAGRRLAEWTDSDEESALLKEGRAQARILTVFRDAFGGRVSVEFNRDPRGAPVQVYLGAVNPARSAHWYF